MSAVTLGASTTVFYNSVQLDGDCLFSLSQPMFPSLVCSLLRLLNTRLHLTIWRRGLPAPCAVRPLQAVLAVERGGQGHHYINAIHHHHKLSGCIRTHLLAVLGLFIRWRKGARPVEERAHSQNKSCFVYSVRC